MAARFSSPSVSLVASRSGLHATSDLFGHLAAWVGLYVGGCVVIAGLLLHGEVSLAALCIAIPTTVGTYLIDRVKPWPGLSDPADKMAHPERAAVLLRLDVPVRLVAITLIVLAALASWLLIPAATVAVIGAPIGVWVYSHRGRLPRPKDRMTLKNLFVAISITALVLLLEGSGSQTMTLLAVGIFLMLNVFADAMLCDIDDRHADARFGTRTIANTLGISETWKLAIVLQCMGFMILVISAAMGQIAWLPALLLGTVFLFMTVALRSVRVARIKDLVDLKLPLAAALAWLLISVADAGLSP
ncbi:MAG: UbiA family prenyltransferase [Phycisphaerales bacterium]|nr:UbiA family prenyltransferase [Phycisphaerales bacterium]